MTTVQTRAKTLTTDLACENCPFKGEDLGRGRFVCNNTNQVVQSNWTATLDCFDAIDALGEEGGENRGSGRLGRLLGMLTAKYAYIPKPGDALALAEFELGIRDGILRSPKIETFHESSPYYQGYAIALSY